MHLGVFQELLRLHAAGEFLLGKEVIVLAITLARSRRTRGAGNGINEVLVGAQTAQSVVFPPPDGAERTNRTPVRWKVLFNVGKLFAYSIKLGLRVHDDT